jgi:thymidine kinase
MVYLKLILGPMFSGKSTKLIELIRKYKIINYKTMPIKHSSDSRYSDDDAIYSHNKDSEPCFKMDKLMSIFEDSIQKAVYQYSQVIIIEEAQFFTDLYTFIIKALDDKKTIFVVGLNGDSSQKNFGDIHKLLPLCDDIELLKAYCFVCKNETPGIFSKRLVSDSGQIHVGGVDEYIPVCRNHY